MQDFYENYDTNLWIRKVTVLYNSVKKFDKLKNELLDGFTESNDEECINSLKLEIHFTYYQIVEALFNIIFAFRRPKIENDLLWHYLVAQSKPDAVKKILKGIKEISEGNTEILDVTILAGENLEVPYLQYLFFFGLELGLEPEDIEKNLDNIKSFLVQCAMDFTDRSDYNAYKHGMRFLSQGESDMEIIDHESQKSLASFKMCGAVVILKYENDCMVQEIKAFDYERDYAMIKVCSQLIHNAIYSRKRYFRKEATVPPMYYFHNLDVRVCSKIETEIPKIKYSIKPIYGNNDTNQKI